MDRYVARPGGPKGPQAQKTETVAHNSVFAGHREAGDQQRTPFDPAAAGLKKFRGYSSVGRAVALQAIGQGFESPYLQILFSRSLDHESRGLAGQSCGRSQVETVVTGPWACSSVG
jgi:hypothetical protein